MTRAIWSVASVAVLLFAMAMLAWERTQ